MIETHQGDITKLEVDAIVNAANPSLRPGHGVCGAIHMAAGPYLASECVTLAPIATGTAVATKAYDLPQRTVIHTVGPVYPGDDSLHLQLRDAYRQSLLLADRLHSKSVAFPAISTGVYDYPMQEAAEIAIDAIMASLPECNHVERVVFCLFDKDAKDTFDEVLAERENLIGGLVGGGSRSGG